MEFQYTDFIVVYNVDFWMDFWMIVNEEIYVAYCMYVWMRAKCVCI